MNEIKVTTIKSTILAPVHGDMISRKGFLDLDTMPSFALRYRATRATDSSLTTSYFKAVTSAQQTRKRAELPQDTE
jgi:hypothetical protein